MASIINTFDTLFPKAFLKEQFYLEVHEPLHLYRERNSSRAHHMILLLVDLNNFPPIRQSKSNRFAENIETKKERYTTGLYLISSFVQSLL